MVAEKRVADRAAFGGGETGAAAGAAEGTAAAVIRAGMLQEPAGGGCGLGDLTLGPPFAVGSMAHVWLVTHRATGRVAVMKCVDKAQVVGADLVKQLGQERHIMGLLDHPFVISLFASFQDHKYAYLVIDFVPGGELFSVFHSTRHEPPDVMGICFYAAVVVECLSYLETLHVVYRDLKPENLLLDALGYPILVDFGYAKQLSPVSGGGSASASSSATATTTAVHDAQTYTLCGTPEYLAPEMIMGYGHDKGIDAWALGCLIHEMLVGRTPFVDARGNSNDGESIFENIMRHANARNLQAQLGGTGEPGGVGDAGSSATTAFGSSSAGGRLAPQHAKKPRWSLKGLPPDIHPTGADLMDELLEPNPARRLGNRHKGMAEIREHRFFKSYRGKGWEHLRARKFRAPIVPAVAAPDDTTNFVELQPGEVTEAADFAGDQSLFAGF